MSLGAVGSKCVSYRLDFWAAVAWISLSSRSKKKDALFVVTSSDFYMAAARPPLTGRSLKFALFYWTNRFSMTRLLIRKMRTDIVFVTLAVHSNWVAEHFRTVWVSMKDYVVMIVTRSTVVVMTSAPQSNLTLLVSIGLVIETRLMINVVRLVMIVGIRNV